MVEVASNAPDQAETNVLFPQQPPLYTLVPFTKICTSSSQLVKTMVEPLAYVGKPCLLIEYVWSSLVTAQPFQPAAELGDANTPH